MGNYDRFESQEQGVSGKSPEALYEEAQKLMNNNSKKEAIGALEMFLAIYPDYALAHNDLGVLYYGEGEKEKALKHYEQAAQLEPQNPVFQKNLADFYYVEQGRVEEAMELYVKVLAANPTDIEVLLILGHICVSLKKFADAKVFYNKVLELEPWNVDAKERLDELAERQRSEVGGQVSEDRYQRTDVGDQMSDVRYQRSEVGGQGPDVRGRGSEIGGQGVEDGLGRGIDDSLIGKFDDLGGDRDQGAGGKGVESAEKMYHDAQELIKSGKKKEGTSVLEMLLKAYPDYAIAHNDLGVLCYNEGNKEEALHHYEKAAQFEPYNDTFQKNLADFYYVEAGRMEEALQIYVKLLETNPTDLETLLILGQICESLKKIEDAKVFYNKVLELEPWNMDARERLRMIG